MGVNITTIAYLRVWIIEIGSTIILMVTEAQGKSSKFHPECGNLMRSTKLRTCWWRLFLSLATWKTPIQGWAKQKIHKSNVSPLPIASTYLDVLLGLLGSKVRRSVGDFTPTKPPFKKLVKPIALSIYQLHGTSTYGISTYMNGWFLG